MKRHSIVVTAFLVGGAAWLAAADVALAQTPLEPVRYVYPDSTYEEIQQAIDDGGTVYFDRLTKLSRQPGDYDQVARSAPDLPPTPLDPARGFNIGTYGREVHVIGLLGPDGERPRINGGTAVFRVGPMGGLGVAGLPVSFRIENLELLNPDLGPPQMAFSRVGIVVTALGLQSVVNNCRITITGKESDQGHAINHSVGIWFLLRANLPEPPPSGALIDVTNNVIVGSRIHEGIHVDSFWERTPGFVPPRPFIGNNTIEVARLGGFPNGAGTDGATLATALIVLGNLHDPIVVDNDIRGDGRSPGATPRVESVAIGLGAANAAGDVLAGVTAAGNDSSGFTGDFQLWIDAVVGSSAVTRNSLGRATAAGVRASGHAVRFVNNHFYGPYPGWEMLPDGPGLFWFTAESGANVVNATKLNTPPHGMDICGQVRDETDGANEIRGYESCER